MIRLQTLGTTELSDGAGRPFRAVLSQPKRLALLVYLALASPRGFHRRDTLLALFWPELDEERARASLSQSLYYLRQSLGSRVVVSRGKDDVAVNAELLWCDALALEQDLATATPDAVASALELYRGELLPGFYLSDAPEFERWLDDERARLRQLAADAAWRAAADAAVDRRSSGAVWLGRRAASIGGWEDRRLRSLLERLASTGDVHAALRLGDEAVHRMRRDLEIEPTPALQAVMHDLRSRAEASPHGSAPVPSMDAPVESAKLQAETRPTQDAASSPSPPPRRSREVETRRRRSAFAVSAAVVSLALVGLLGRFSSPRQIDATRVAVLPITHMGSDSSSAWIADGLTAELISRMAALRDLRVIPFSTMMRYRAPRRDLRTISRELAAGTLIESSVRSNGSVIRLTVTLIDAANEETLWSGSYTARMDQLLAVQQQIAEDAARALKIEQRSVAAHRQETRWPGNMAYEEYLRGRAMLGRIEIPALRRALTHFRRATEQDSTFALALSGLSSAYYQLIANFAMSQDSMPLVRRFAEQALALDDDLPEAHAALAIVLWKYYWDSKGAKRHFARAIALDPSHADAYRGYASQLRDEGDFVQALEQIRLARDLDRSPMSALEEGVLLYLWGRHDDAIATLAPLMAGGPEAPRARFTIALAQAARGDVAAAQRSLDLADPDSSRPNVLAYRAYLTAKTGRIDEARGLLARYTSARPGLSAFQRAVVYTALGDHERAIALLEQAADERSMFTRLFKVEPTLAPLRSDPRFQLLLERTGFSVSVASSAEDG